MRKGGSVVAVCKLVCKRSALCKRLRHPRADLVLKCWDDYEGDDDDDDDHAAADGDDGDDDGDHGQHDHEEQAPTS